MRYSDFLNQLKTYAEEEFAEFQRRLIFTSRKILGVRTPTLRRFAKEYKGDLDELFSYPNEYYETVFIKLTVVSRLPYAEFVSRLEDCVTLIDNWALCDCFKCKAITKHRQEFLSVLEKIFSNGGEFYQRYVLVSLLSYYVDERYLQTIKEYILRADTQRYYVHMAVAWLTAEVLIKHYDAGLLLLDAIKTDVKTYNKSIQKAVESFRLTKEQKDCLRSFKIK
ncbi:MAG: DNA alkylation repair protein [Clostridia bacterium]|nr:DNA alkylation repair protein [Clostridia bacterium]